MPRTVPIEDAGRHLREIIEALDPSEEVTIVADHEPVATLRRKQRKF